jgi:hypothetical protein
MYIKQKNINLYFSLLGGFCTEGRLFCVNKKNPERWQCTNDLLVNMLLKYYTITALERDQCEVLWSRVKYCCTLLHKTSYWSSSNVVIVLLYTALFYSNFEILWKLWNFWNFLKILSFWIPVFFFKSYEIFESFEFSRNFQN